MIPEFETWDYAPNVFYFAAAISIGYACSLAFNYFFNDRHPPQGENQAESAPQILNTNLDIDLQDAVNNCQTIVQEIKEPLIDLGFLFSFCFFELVLSLIVLCYTVFMPPIKMLFIYLINSLSDNLNNFFTSFVLDFATFTEADWRAFASDLNRMLICFIRITFAIAPPLFLSPFIFPFFLV